MSERLGKIHFWIMLIGFNMTFMPMHILGVLGMPRRVYTYSADQNWAGLNLFVSIGAFVIAVSILLMIVNLLRSARKGEEAGANPWGASTLEWAIPSPPPHYNFAVIPTVRSQHPLWDEEANVTEPPPLPAHGEPHMPSPSYWPMVVAFGVTMVGGGLLIWQANTWLGLAVIAISGWIGMHGVYGWIFEPPTAEEGHGEHAAHGHGEREEPAPAHRA